MSLGLKSTLFAGVITLSAFAPAFAAAPVIANLPDVTIGDLEDSTESTDNNVFVFSDAFTFSDFVQDADSNTSELMWSFGEYSGGLAPNQYAINGITAINTGDTEIADDEANGHEKALNPGSSQINISEPTASFRDIVLSPLPDASPYDSPSQADADIASAGKLIRYYVSDGANVDFSEAIVRTVDDDFDSTTPVYFEDYQEVVRDGDLQGDGWTPSGPGWGAVSVGKANGELSITVQPTFASSRFYGWANPALMNYNDVGADRFVRGKFYVYTNVDLLEPINKVPNFRLRITHENAVNAAAHFELATTAYSDPGYEPYYAAANDPAREGIAGFFLRPADDNFVSPTPSLYRVDFDPVDVPAAANSNIGALMESYTVHDTANGSLYLTEVVLGTYKALDNSGELEWSYNRADGFNAGAGGAKVAGGGGFNHEANLTSGYLQDLYLQPEPGGYFQVTGNAPGDTAGVIGDSNAVAGDVFGIGLMNFQSADNANKLRIESNKLYHARFYATAPVPATSADPNEEVQGAIRFRFQTAASTVSYLLDMSTLAFGSLDGPSTPNASAIAAQALPGTTSQNPDTDPTLDTAGEGGGWYSVVVASPLDYNGIRNDIVALFGSEPGFDETGQFFFLGAQPGPGNPADSAKDVTLGVDFIQPPLSVTTGAGVFPLGRPARAVARISAVEVYSYPSIDDGGFDAAPTAVHP